MANDVTLDGFSTVEKITVKAYISERLLLREAASKAYYEGESIISDIEFDKLTQELEDAGISEVVGHGYTPTTNTITHQYPLLSLRKVRKMEEIVNWGKGKIVPPFSVQLKYDGNALDLTYDENGKFLRAATRGNGKVGENVTHTVEAMIAAGRIPAKIDVTGYSDNTHILGEAIMSHTDFASLNADQSDREYSNPRNSTAGLLRRKTTELAKYLSFVAYDSNHYDKDEIAWLAANKFITPNDHFYEIAQNIDDVEKAINKIETTKNSTGFGFDIDGAVVKMYAPRDVRERIGNATSSPRWAVAYKYENVILETVIRSVEWNQTRTGRLVPVAIFDEVILAGNAKTTRATLHNYGQFNLHALSSGDTILITRSNEVIPFVVGKKGDSPAGAVKFVAPAHYPSEEFATHLNATGLDLLVHKDAPPAAGASIEYALKALNVKGVGPALVQELLDALLISNFIDLLSITEEDIVSIVGKENSTKTAENAVAAIKTVFDQPLSLWIAAMGMPFIAFNKSPILEERYDSLEALSKATNAELMALEGFGGEKSASILKNSARISEWALRLKDELKFSPKPAQKVAVKASTGDVDYMGKKVVVTGSFPTMARKDVEAWVVAHGGKISSSVSSSTNILVAGEKAGSKLAKANELGIQVVDAADFEADA